MNTQEIDVMPTLPVGKPEVVDSAAGQDPEGGEKRVQRTQRALPAKPIMVYPQSEEQRRMFEEAALKANRKLSPFMVHAVQEYIRMTNLLDTPEGRVEAARRRLQLESHPA